MKRALLAGLLTFSTAAAQARTQIVPRPPSDQGSSDASEEKSPGGFRRSDTPRPAAVAPPANAPAGPRTRIIRRPADTTPPRGPIVPDTGIARDIERRRRVEITPDRYYWHTQGGKRYVHYYDRRRHWYGFYDGPRFHWTSWHRDRWWWYDSDFHRWNYWQAGHWWWPAPTGAVFVYVDGDYRPYEDAGLRAARPEDVSPPDAPDAAPAAPAGGSWTSPDKRRMVQVFGARSEAFLYDVTDPAAPRFIKHLGQNVEKVRFSGGTDGKPLRVLLDQKDGSFAWLTADGESVDGPSAP